MSQTLPKHSFYEIALQGPSPEAAALERARVFFLTQGFQTQELVYFNAKGKFRLCVYIRSPLKMRALLRRYAGKPIKKVRIKISFLGQKDWLDKWRLDYRIRPLGARCILIPQNHREKFRQHLFPMTKCSPSAAQSKPRLGQGKRHPIFLEPHAAFGTGTHETTRFMIRLIETLEGKFASVMDAGTGTGILAVVAWRLGARTILGIDIESHAVKTAQENLRLNACYQASFQRVSLGQLNTRAHFDLVTANLMTNVLIRDRLILSRLVRKGGYLAVSGISLPHFEGFRKAFAHARIRCRRILKGKGWVALLYQRVK